MSDANARGPVERLVRHDQWIVAGAASLVVLLSGWYTYAGVDMDMTALDMTQIAGPIGDLIEHGPQPV